MDSKKQRFLRARAELARLEGLRDAIEEPFRKQMRMATQRMKAALEAASDELADAEDDCPVHLGQCETCLTPLFAGDEGSHFSDDGWLFCAEHSPTYAYLLACWEQEGADDWESESSFQDWLLRGQGLRAHDPQSKYVYVLG